MTDEHYHLLAREIAQELVDPDKKQLRFNEIVATAKAFYPKAIESGIEDLVTSCDRAFPNSYTKGQPMWRTLNEQYRWMI